MKTKLLAKVEYEKDWRSARAKRSTEVNRCNMNSNSWGPPQDSKAIKSVGGYMHPSTADEISH